MFLVSLMSVNIKLIIRKYHVARFVESFWSLPQESLTNPRILKLDGVLEAISESDAFSLGKFIAKVAHLFFVRLNGFPLLPQGLLPLIDACVFHAPGAARRHMLLWRGTRLHKGSFAPRSGINVLFFLLVLLF